MKRANMVKRVNYPIIDVLLVFLVCFIPKFIIAINSIMINTISDEVSSMSIAAFLAGYDWRDVVSNAGYYGIGYLFIFFPLFKAGVPALTIYRIILSVNAGLIGFTGVICYFILSHFIKIENRLVKITISCTCGCMSIFSTSITRSRNEDIYLLCGWLFACVFLKLLDDSTGKKIKYEALMLLLLLYMLSVHSRAITYMIALILVCVLDWLFFHKKLVSKFFWLSLIAGASVCQILLRLYQKWVWQSDSVRNASVGGTVSSVFSKLAYSKLTIDFNMVKSCLMIIFGQLFTAFSLSGGIFLISFVIFIFFVYQYMKSRDTLRSEEHKLLVLGVLYSLMIMITIFGQGIIWGVTVYQGIISGESDYKYAYKAFTYMRYMGSYVPVFVMVALIICWNYWNIWKKVYLWVPVAFVGLLLFWINTILPYVKDTKSNMEFFISIVSLPYEMENSVDVWYKMFLILFLMAFIWMFFNNKKAFLIKLLVLGILFPSYERMEIFNNKILLSEEAVLGRVDAGYEVLQQLHDNVLTDDIDICVVETQNKTDHQIWYIYQFLNYDLHIIPGSKDNISLTDIIFSNGKIADCLPDDYVCFQLDKNEYMYSKNTDYCMMVKLLGYDELVK